MTEKTDDCKPADCNASKIDDYCFKLIDLHNQNRIDYNERKWETLKLSHGLFSGLIVATVAIIVNASKEQFLEDFWLRFIIAVLPTMAFFASRYGGQNLERESRLLFMDELQMFKLAKFIGLDIEVPTDRRWLTEDKCLLSCKWRDSTYKAEGKPTTQEEWITARMRGHKEKHNFLAIYDTLFLVEMGLSLILIIAILFWPYIPNIICGLCG